MALQVAKVGRFLHGKESNIGGYTWMVDQCGLVASEHVCVRACLGTFHLNLNVDLNSLNMLGTIQTHSTLYSGRSIAPDLDPDTHMHEFDPKRKRRSQMI